VEEEERIAEAVKQACVEAALRAYEEGGISGLCAEGRWELAVDALRHLDTASILQQLSRSA
jgi:hypothetical protein